MTRRLRPSDQNRKHAMMALSKTIGARLRQARDLCGYSQMRAAELLGYSNSSRLAKIEGGQARTVPLDTIIAAAKLYDVSVDFLLGLADDWEVGLGPMMKGLAQNQTFAPWLLEHWERMRNRDMAAMVRLYDEFSKVKRVADVQIRAAKEVSATLDSFVKQNRGFDELRVSNKLLVVAKRMAEQAGEGEKIIKRFTMSCQVAAQSKSERQLVLPIEREAYNGE